ncbi:MAG: protease family protein [Subtercola sp.]|nr:protease family protein [Subtercola sp.]
MSHETTSHETEHARRNAWQRFFDRGGWWKAVLVLAVYSGLYQLYGLLVGAIFGSAIDTGNLFANPQSVFLGLALPILLGGVTLLIFIGTVRWVRELFGPQPLKGRGWMWIAVALLVIPIALRVAATNWSSYAVSVILATLLAGVFIGFAEELLTRGIAVNLLRRAGYGEKAVLVLSSLLFALLHSVNAFTQAPVTVLVTLVYTFGYGAMMYLVLRVTGNIIWPMLLHAATDPTTILATGGVDTTTASAGSAGLISVAGIFNYLYIVFAVLAIILVKGKVFGDRSPRGRKAGMSATTDSAAV